MVVYTYVRDKRLQRDGTHNTHNPLGFPYASQPVCPVDLVEGAQDSFRLRRDESINRRRARSFLCRTMALNTFYDVRSVLCLRMITCHAWNESVHLTFG